MILHICGNLAAGKTTTAFDLQPHLHWPVVPVGRIRAICHDESLVWYVVERLWQVWDTPSMTPGRSGIWVSTGLNWNERRILSLAPPRYLRRVWLTAPPDILRMRLAQRGSPAPSFWPYQESWENLQEELMEYDTSAQSLPWPVDRQFNTYQKDVDTITKEIIDMVLEPWHGQAQPQTRESFASWQELLADLPVYSMILGARQTPQWLQ